MESDNQSLRAEIASSRKWIAGKEAQAKAGYTEESVPRHEYDALQSEYDRILRARDLLESRCRRYKESLKEWREYRKVWIMKKGPRSAEQTRPVGFLLESEQCNVARVPTPPVPPEVITPTPSHVPSKSKSPSNDSGVHPETSQRFSEHRTTEEKGIESKVTPSEVPSARSTDLIANGGTETSTDSDSQPAAAAKPPKSGSPSISRASHTVPMLGQEYDDVPVIVSERSLKRKRFPVTRDVDTKSIADTNIKDEPGKSSPVVPVSSRPLGCLQDSLDLDDIGRSVGTPKKRRRLKQMWLLSSFDPGSRVELSPGSQGDEGQPDEDLFNYLPPIEYQDVSKAMRPVTGIVAECLTSSNALDEAGKEQRGGRPPHAVKAVEQDALDNRVPKGLPPSLSNDRYRTSSSGIDFARHENLRHERRSAEHRNNIVLGPIDPNVLPRTSSAKGRLVPPSRRDRGAVHVPALAEDGEEYAFSKSLRRSRDDMTSPMAPDGRIDALAKAKSLSPYRRLNTLMNDAAPEKAVPSHAKPNVALIKSVQSPKMPSALSKGASVNRAKHDFYPTRINKVVKTHSEPPIIGKTLLGKDREIGRPPVVLPEDEPLRARSIDRLRLTDFKLNKNHSEFAYHESIRKHDEKRKLGGCTDPFCDRCKEVARFAELTGYVAPPTSRLFGSSALDAEATEQQLIEEYIGHDRKRLNKLDSAERKEIFKKAREKSFVDLYGKHRQLHNRAVSPPGYWETEFPSTQQEAENREAARVIDRVRIKERYDEALRGGLWKFADE